MTIAAIFNYFESMLWFAIALSVFVKSRITNQELKTLAVMVSVTFVLFGISDLVEASTGAWWRPLWLLGLKGLCVLSFIYCWIKYIKIKNQK